MINKEEQNYLNLLKGILQNGSDRKDRTGIGTKSIFGTRLRFSLEDGRIPMLTTKKMFAKGCIEELLFFIRGETDTKKLEEKGVNIWKGNTSRKFLDSRGLTYLKEGDMGKGYGFQWRRYGEDKCDPTTSPSRWALYDVDGVDQLKELVEGLKNDPHSRRHIITAWNPSQLKEMTLPPCHCFAQFYVDDGKLSCQYYQRSVDGFLGLPFNLMSYGILTHLIAKITGLEAGELIFVGGDTHIYLTHLKQVEEQLTREPYDFPRLNIKKEISSIEDIEEMEFGDFEIVGYESYGAIKAEMAV